ncbi:unnamed protein product [Cylicocyclus nassatus]|uniref:Uncharacterized protein n=1 Tax=Cylicocyclus nassatus TaxID=53992 RepID=A0AA36H9R8_CYLNA|nr:unnamed protein product [Cylicocyclus nassatus]
MDIVFDQEDEIYDYDIFASDVKHALFTPEQAVDEMMQSWNIIAFDVGLVPKAQLPPLNTIFSLEIQSDVEGTNTNDGDLSDLDGNGSNVNGGPPDMDVDAANPPTNHEESPQRRPLRQAMMNTRTIIRIRKKLIV